MPQDNDDTGRYIGHERRSGKERRHQSVRREEIRFEPDRDDRRDGSDRRKQGGWDNTSDRR